MDKYCRDMNEKPNSELASVNNTKAKTISAWTVIFILLAFIVIGQVGIEISGYLGYERCQKLERSFKFGKVTYNCLDSN